MNDEFPRNLKLVTVWLLFGAAVFVGVEWWQRQAEQTRFRVTGDAVEIRRGADGHYHWPGRINGHEVVFLIDTGATGTAMPASLAVELGLASLGAVRSSTANGSVTGHVVRVDLELEGGVEAQRLKVVALPGLGPHPLLGMDVLGQLRWQQRDAVLRIEPSVPR